MNGYNKQYITRADFQSLTSVRIPYTGFIKGEGYAYTAFGFIPPAHQQRVSAPNRVPYNRSFNQTTLTQYIDKSPEAQARSLNIQPDDLVKLLVTKRPGGGYNINMGNGHYEQVSAESKLISTITDTPTGLKYEIGYFDKATGKGKTSGGLLREMHITFASTADQMPPLEIPGEINLSASKVLMELPTKEQVVQKRIFWLPYGWIFTDPNGTASSDATPFRAHKSYVLSDALLWISLIGSMSRPRANNRSTNFWAWFGKFFGKVEEVGSAVSPKEAYGVGSAKTPTHIAEKEYGKGNYSTWIKESPNMFYDLTRDSVLLIRPTGDSLLYIRPTQNPLGVRNKVPTNFKNNSK